MSRKGGSYEIVDGKPVLKHRTEPPAPPRAAKKKAAPTTPGPHKAEPKSKEG